jgi:tRNA1Val (adenine37-N6)-methyltransferase
LRRLKNRKESQNLGTIDLKPGERLDDLQRNGYRIIQDPDKFCFGMDAVLLSGFASAPDGGRVLDLGTGTGIIPILMAAKTGAKELVGLEIQPESAEMANRSVILNDLEEKVKIVEGDIKEAGELFEAASFDVVTSNPPYMIGGHGLQNPDGPKAIARHEVLCDLEDVVKAAARCLKPGGKFYMVHRPFRLAEIMVVMNRYKLEPKRMRLVYPFIDKEPSMVLIEGARGGKSRITVEPPLIIYESQHKYTKEIYDIYGF